MCGKRSCMTRGLFGWRTIRWVDVLPAPRSVDPASDVERTLAGAERARAGRGPRAQ